MKGEQISIVIVFPGNPLQALIRRTARELQHVQGRAADRLWRERMRFLQSELTRKGIVGAEMQAEIDQFALDVHGELQRLTWDEWHAAHRPGGDAA
ncbi:hypothetical protein SAMN03159463_05310 [Mesorhizobium sp. NFR06]|uniref:DUF6074 family protein n=1 Tax=Mesorhizobium sp. NFR06 TaxID=1566290 RepID=UPI0008E8BCC8|nr:DUF6074 family protein [Mesorhizobium sp. NFR06]SFP98287.1 hypothetical protein SAMN03159463_05310 [Mesorhizobium sp. NFR06]